MDRPHRDTAPSTRVAAGGRLSSGRRSRRRYISSENQRAPRAPRGERKQVDYSEYEAADEKEFVTGKVNSIQDYGAFITLKEGVDGLVHISQIQEGGVGKVSDVLSQGQEVQVRIVSVDKSKGRIGLSMKPWVEGAEEEQGGRRSRRDSASRRQQEADQEYRASLGQRISTRKKVAPTKLGDADSYDEDEYLEEFNPRQGKKPRREDDPAYAGSGRPGGRPPPAARRCRGCRRRSR